MTNEFTKKAAKMLLNGATLLKEPCPYCKGVRVMKDGNALCTNCGREPEKREIPENKATQVSKSSFLTNMEKKLESLSKELENEKEYEKQQEILKSINLLIEALEKVKK